MLTSLNLYNFMTLIVIPDLPKGFFSSISVRCISLKTENNNPLHCEIGTHTSTWAELFEDNSTHHIICSIS